MEANNWKIGYRKNGTLLDVVFVPKFLLKSHFQKNFINDGRIRKNVQPPTLFFIDEEGNLKTVDIVRTIKGYVQDNKGKIYKVKGLEKYTSEFKMTKGRLVKNQKNPYEKQFIQFISVTGKDHTVNEDSFVGVTHPESPDIKLLLVADGMGGHDAGEVASKMVADKIFEWFIVQDVKALENSTWVYNNIPKMIKNVSTSMWLELACKRNIESGSTLAMALVNSKHTIAANVGDSRIGIVREDGLKIVSIEDSPLTSGDRPLTPKEQDLLRVTPGNNYITQFMGMLGVQPHVHVMRNEEYSDIFLFSDGITDCMNYSTLNKIACNIDKNTLFKFILEASYGKDEPGAKGKAVDDETVVHYSKR